MRQTRQNTGSGRRQKVKLAWLLIAVTGACFLGNGCASWSNPVADGIPVSRVPPEYFVRPKEETKTIPLTLLRQKPPDVYRLAPGDILGIYVEGVLGDKTQPLPVRFPELGKEQGKQTPGIGYPIPVREDGTLPLPLVEPVQVNGMTVIEAQEAVTKAYLAPKKLLKEGNERVIVSLLRPRQYHVQVIRQDSGTIPFAPTAGNIFIGNARRGTGASIDLPAYENDVLNALSRTGGLPGLDAMNEIVVQRGYYRPVSQGGTGENCKGNGAAADQASAYSNTQVIRIPLRLRDGEPPPFKPEDVILQNGDIVFIEARDTEVFYTGGILFPRQFVVPRDYDLRVVEAVALSGGPLLNGAATVNNLSGTVLATGFGSPTPSRLSVLRRTKDRGQIIINVDLLLAMRDPRENIIVQGGDVIILQETLGESFTRYFVSVFHYNALGFFANRRDFIGTANLFGP
jgi:protein involved in polysaccharide export with SLBB domain